MRRVPSIFALLAALAAYAVDPALLMRTQADPTRMLLVPGVHEQRIAEGFMDGGETAFTLISWIRFHRTNTLHISGPYAFWSMDAARSTREGGAELPALVEYQTVTDSSGGTFANPHYACPETLEDKWQYGCYAVNIETPVPVTVTIAGTEKSVAASNGVKQVFNILGSAADYSWSVTGPTGGATPLKFGFAVNPLVQFYGVSGQPTSLGYGDDTGPGRIGTDGITNEWVMCVSQVKIDGTRALERMALFTWDTETFPDGVVTNAGARASFARDARVSIAMMHFGDIGIARDVYGTKLFPRWLSDDELRNVRDLDVFEMQRRGITRFTEEQ